MAANQTIEKFQKGAYYEDVNGDLFYCTNGRKRKTDDGHFVVDMKATKHGKPTGKANEEYRPAALFATRGNVGRH